MSTLTLTGAAIFDGVQIHHGKALVLRDGCVAALTDGPHEGTVLALNGGVLAPGFIDLQVNGAGGWMVGADATLAHLREMCDIHASLGATGILPTLITDRPEAVAAVLYAGRAAARAHVQGFLGLHLEGPHLDPARAGAHDPALIRIMADDDLARLCEAASDLPALMVTLAPESVQPEQIAQLSRAGVIVALGHSGCSYEMACTAIRAGARVVTHLFNAMSGLGHRDPGLAGAALRKGVDVGLIADGYHVHPAMLDLAMASKRAGRMFLVSDAMAVAGSEISSFMLDGREIRRADGCLTMADGTLAGADLTLPQAVGIMLRATKLPLAQVLAMASATPAAVIGTSDRHGHIQPGRVADLVHLSDTGALLGVWQRGRKRGTRQHDGFGASAR